MKDKKVGPLELTSLVSFALFTFWENFIVGIRILDFFGLGLIFVVLLISKERIHLPRKRLEMVFILFIIFNAFYVLLGLTLAAENFPDIKAAGGFGLGILVFILFYTIDCDPRRVLKLVNALLMVHSSTLMLQMLLYYLLNGYVLNLNPFYATGDLRVLDVGFLRPSGFFAEPASHGLTITMLITLKMRYWEEKRIDFVTVFSMVTAWLSLSIWSMVSSLLWIVYFARRRAVAISLVASVFFVGLIYDEILSDNPIISNLVLQRIERFVQGDEASLEARYLSSPDYFSFDEFNISSWLGSGVRSAKGMNSYVRFLDSHGVVGFFLFVSLLAVLTPREHRKDFVVWLLLLLTAAGSLPFLFLWWAWLALFVKRIPQGGDLVRQSFVIPRLQSVRV